MNTMQSRAYAMFEVKALDNDHRIIEGMASTPTPDRMGDIVEPLGAEFALPLPLLWQHDKNAPVGLVEFAKATNDGIPFRARLAKIAETGPLKDMVDLAWQAVKERLVRGVSIGFQSSEYSYIENTGGRRFSKWEWLELSLVTIPAQREATISTIKSISTEQMAASGRSVIAASGKTARVARLAPRVLPSKPFVINRIIR